MLEACTRLCALINVLVLHWQVENPIPFEASLLSRTLSIGHLHSRYAGLLIAPAQLSADWSYACIPLVKTLSDLRNLSAAALYLSLLGVFMASKPQAALLKMLQGRSCCSVNPDASWLAVVVFGILVSFEVL